jgi:hypothetical protein
MEILPPLTSTLRRRRRIVTLALIPTMAALAIAWLEAGHWLIVYNDTDRPLAGIAVRCGPATWTLPELEPRASRRLRLSRTDDHVVFVSVADWAPEPAYPISCDWREVDALTVRLQASRTVAASPAGGIPGRLLRW